MLYKRFFGFYTHWHVSNTCTCMMQVLFYYPIFLSSSGRTGCGEVHGYDPHQERGPVLRHTLLKEMREECTYDVL